jgi:RNA polymerase sigma-70 factor (ECF subfamily)
MTEAELVAAVAEGRVDALRQLHDLHAPWLAARLYRRCSDQTLVDETVQDTFATVWRTAHRYRGEGEVGAWLWGIAIRKLIDRLRQRRLPRLDRPGVVESAEDVVLAGVGYGDLGKALQRLSPELMAVVQATILDGLTAREAGRLLGIPAGTVKTRLMRAKKQLREQLA